jgi:hypothetical protein
MLMYWRYPENVNPETNKTDDDMIKKDEIYTSSDVNQTPSQPIPPNVISEPASDATTSTASSSTANSNSGTGYNSKLKQPIYTAVKTEAVTLPTADNQPILECRFKHSTPNDEILKQFFSASTGSTWRTNNLGQTSKKETADVFYGAVNIHGLPMAVILDGCGRSAQNKAVQFLAIHLISLLEKLTTLLQGSNFTDKQIKSHIKKQYETLDSYLHSLAECDAAFSAVALYEDSSRQLKSISFGIGDTMVALIEPGQNNISTVVAARNVNEEGLPPLSFPCQPTPKSSPARIMANLEQIIKIRKVKPNSKFVFLTDGSYECLATTKRTLAPDAEGESMLETTLGTYAIHPETTVQEIIEEADQFISQKFKEDQTVGDDTTAASMIVPTPDEQKVLQAFLYNQAIKFYNETLIKIENALLRQQALDFRNHIEQMLTNSPSDMSSLTKALIKTNYILTCYQDKQISLSDISDYHSYMETEFSGGPSSQKLIFIAVIAFLYNKEMNSLDSKLQELEAKPKLYNKALAVRNQIEQMRYDPSNNMVSLITTLTNTNDLITSYTKKYDSWQADLSNYRDYIHTGVLSGKPSLELKILGAAMIALGVTLAIAGGLSFAVGNVLGGFVFGGGGVALILAGCGIFSKGRGKGLYKLTSSLADGLEENSNPGRLI